MNVPPKAHITLKRNATNVDGLNSTGSEGNFDMYANDTLRIQDK